MGSCSGVSGLASYGIHIIETFLTAQQAEPEASTNSYRGAKG